MNSKRRGVLVALLTFFSGRFYGAYGQKRPEETETDPIREKDLLNAAEFDMPVLKHGSGFEASFEVEDATTDPHPTYFLIVRADNRVVKFTAQQVMDILEGRII